MNKEDMIINDLETLIINVELIRRVIEHRFGKDINLLVEEIDKKETKNGNRPTTRPKVEEE